MLTIAWYNVVAIIVVILWIVWLLRISKNDQFGIGTAFAVLLGVAFLAIWSGIFWW